MGVALKFYACVASNHATLDALREMRQERAFSAGDVERIVVRGSRVTVDHVGWKYVPQGLTSAQLNLSYCVATLLIEGDCFVEQFTEDKVADSERMAIAERVEVRHDPGITEKGANFRHMVHVELRLKDGTKLERTVQAARGSEVKFASTADVMTKFHKLAGRVLPHDRVVRLREAVLGLEKLEDAAELARLMAR